MAQQDGVSTHAELYQGVHKGSTAYRLLSSMGWKEGQGLGAQKQGITSHVKIKKKFDSTGVGLAEKHERQRDWTIGMVNFESILSTLKEVAARHDSSGDEGTPGKPSTSGSDHQPPAKKSKKEKKEKKVKREKKNKDATAAEANPLPSKAAAKGSCSGSGSDDEAAGNGTVHKHKNGANKLATHVGRYHRRERAKSVRGYSAGDLAAILGAAPGGDGYAAAAIADPGAPEWAPTGATAVQASHAADDSDDEDDESNLPQDGQLNGAAGGHHGGVGASGNGGQAAGDGVPAAPRAWWSSMFVRSGRMGSTKHELHSRKVSASAAAPAAGAKKSITINGFSEQDQENLYTQAHLGATHGKQGLGKADAPKKVAGVRWSGTKTKIGSDSDEELPDAGEANGSGSDSSSDDEVPGAVVVMASKKEQAEGHVAKEVLMLKPAKLPQIDEKKKSKKSTVTASPVEVAPIAAARTADGGNSKLGSAGSKRKRAVGSSDGESLEVAQTAGANEKGHASAVKPAKGTKGSAKAEKGGKVQWSKLAQRVLKEAPKQRLKLQQLKAQVFAAAEMQPDGCDKQLFKKLRALPEVFEVGDKYVKLL